MNSTRVVLAPLLVASLALCGCEPSQPDHAGWRDQAYYVVSGVDGDVATAYLLVQQLIRDRVPGNYAQVGLVTAEDDAGKQTQKLTKLQPPAADGARSRKVSSTLSDAGDLLTAVRIAVVRRSASRYPALAARLKKQQSTLDTTVEQLGGLRG